MFTYGCADMIISVYYKRVFPEDTVHLIKYTIYSTHYTISNLRWKAAVCYQRCRDGKGNITHTINRTANIFIMR